VSARQFPVSRKRSTPCLAYVLDLAEEMIS